MIPYNDSEIINLDVSNLADNPSGTIKDATSATSFDGTRMNKRLFADWWAAVWKAVRNTGITPNTLHDNETNGYQLHEALFASPWTGITSVYGSNYQWRYENGGECIRIVGIINNTSASGIDSAGIITLPVGIIKHANSSMVVRKNNTETEIVTLAAQSYTTHIIKFGSTLEVGGYLYINNTIAIDNL